MLGRDTFSAPVGPTASGPAGLSETINPTGTVVDFGRPEVETLDGEGEVSDRELIAATVATTPTTRRMTTPSQNRRRRRSRCFASLKSRSAFVRIQRTPCVLDSGGALLDGCHNATIIGVMSSVKAPLVTDPDQVGAVRGRSFGSDASPRSGCRGDPPCHC